MPRQVRDPITNTFGIAFGHGGSRSNMATPRPGSAGTTTSRGDCVQCVEKHRQGHRSAREPKYCERHQCVDKDSSGVMCTNRKKAADVRCSTHTKCKVSRCSNPRSLDVLGIPNDYCLDHACPVDDCTEGKAHDPRRNVYDIMCATHLLSKCAVTSCLGWKTDVSRYCEIHVCIIETCNSKVISESRPFCIDHNTCRVEGCPKERCQFGNQFESVCLDHYVAPCAGDRCNQKCSPPSQYCDMHACQVKNCLNDARPGRGRPFCLDHKCSDNDCQFLRTYSEAENGLKKNSFCSRHECRSEGCTKHTVPEKPYCNSHYCTKQGCTEARDRDPRFATLCYPHYEGRIRDAAAAATERRINEEREREEREELEAAQVRAEEARRAQQQQQQQQQQRMPHRPREDSGRRQDDRWYNIPPPRRPERYGGVRPDREPRYEDAYEDEGYRSRPGSGAYGQG